MHTPQHPKLSPNPTIHNLLPSNRRIIHPSRLNHILGRPLPSLIITAESPCISLPVLINSQAGIRSGSDVDTLDIWHDVRSDQVSWLAVLVEKEMFFVQILDLDTGLVTVNAAPDEDLTSNGASESVVGAACNLLDVVVGEGFDDGGCGDGVLDRLFVLGYAGLAE